MSTGQWAIKAGLTRNTIYRIRAGEVDPTLKNLDKLADALDAKVLISRII